MAQSCIVEVFSGMLYMLQLIPFFWMISHLSLTRGLQFEPMSWEYSNLKTRVVKLYRLLGPTPSKGLVPACAQEIPWSRQKKKPNSCLKVACFI